MTAPADWPIFGRDSDGVAWRPTDALRNDSQLARFLRRTGEASLDALQARAVVDPGWFWGAAADDLGIAWARAPASVLDATRGPAWTRWWPGADFNYAWAALAPRVSRDPDGEALRWEGEDGAIRQLTNRELDAAVAGAVRELRELGVGPGDRVGVLLPMLVETVVAVLALGILRAIYTPIFSGYAAPAIAARLADCEASVLITVDGFRRRGSWVPLKSVADDAVRAAPSVRRVVVVRRAGAALSTPWTDGRDSWWAGMGPGEPHQAPTAASEPTDPETPYMIIYTSGTTGRPKGAVHVHGGFPIKGAQDLAHQFDLGAGDRLFWFTDLGWMMGPWAISGSLLRGASLVLYEGAPDHPGPDRLWELVARHKVTHLGLSPTVIRALMAHGEEPVRAHDRSSLRVLGSTGEPWNPDPWWWYCRVVGDGRCPIVNYSGGTEVSGGIVSGNVMGPIKPASFSGPCIGTAADVVDEAGGTVRGAVGELVIRAPMPGMTRGFWRDEEHRYEATYWSRIPGTWVHGDWASIDRDGFWYIQGRSDDTLKIAGKRVGPAEVESAAVSHPSVLEAAAIGIPHEIKGEVVVVLAVLRPGEVADAGLLASVGETVARQLGKPLKPERVVAVPSLPKTRSGKVMRRAIRAAWLDIDPGDLSGLDDPGILETIRAGATDTGPR
jgi:acetyl-CoA synthetase